MPATSGVMSVFVLLSFVDNTVEDFISFSGTTKKLFSLLIFVWLLLLCNCQLAILDLKYILAISVCVDFLKVTEKRHLQTQTAALGFKKSTWHCYRTSNVVINAYFHIWVSRMNCKIRVFGGLYWPSLSVVLNLFLHVGPQNYSLHRPLANPKWTTCRTSYP